MNTKPQKHLSRRSFLRGGALGAEADPAQVGGLCVQAEMRVRKA